MRTDDSGKIERGVKASRLAMPPPTSSIRARDEINEMKSNDGDIVFFVGEKVECPNRGSRELYRGKIVKDNSNGSYKVLFDNGDEDESVPERSMKRVSESADPLR